MKIIQSRSFKWKVKKFSKQEKKVLDKQVIEIAKTPYIGTEKKGDLRGVFIHKFKLKSIEYLLSYRFIRNDFELIIIGPHENYYRDLKNYLKTR
ncbi:MAG: type II toxin-antitoxin system RelE/ParE family toxin [Desulfobacula sp.]|jgi:mRNA interferase RelE/StbE|uniref:type II toxin-antitoxin system RelE/ParE family toxin n=1 Tax=Desulfobacula sp. TaxID=2593537 RepID=UPI001DE62134|nr:type II toxin-antitoxin system RelE/ParE family toxin [Desulfobacula sp.]MBT3805602.1 type II toxin-antitoxin system RelE/ParE family toxin [Desulfobacula sp.]MBT4026474.1 type II toxin-antitoxin system RelE/ParE family toxin [Desulfobacula sp.]MBT4874705.1 type II toxin-antitoxin system RelE/ParE family toxin [Desulfobacula sp.]MBT5544746.1 type II toxin-antitoxin system RelE/ParE family toxin [Desulfobacula sp.]